MDMTNKEPWEIRCLEIIDTCRAEANRNARKYANTDDSHYKAEYLKFWYTADMVQSIIEEGKESD